MITDLHIDQLSDNQAQHALLFFTQELPRRLWPHHRLDFYALRDLATSALAQADPSSDLTNALLGDHALRGKICRSLLLYFEQNKDYYIFVDTGVHYSRQPRMAEMEEYIQGPIIACRAIKYYVENGFTERFREEYKIEDYLGVGLE